MEEVKERLQLVCLRCGEANPEGLSRCGACQCPLDDFASSSPWEMGSAENSAYHDPTDPVKKPIVFWGVWLWFGSTVFVCLHEVVVFLTSDFVSGGFIALMLPLLYSFLGIWALSSVTQRYLWKDAEDSREGEVED